MKVGVLGTGIVGRSLAVGFERLGHEVAIGTRDVEALRTRTGEDAMGNPAFSIWHQGYPQIRVELLAEAAAMADMVVNATKGAASLDALGAAGRDHLAGKILIDTSNPIDEASGFPFTLFVANTDSLAERIQRAFPEVRLVKAWNTMTASLMCDPGSLAGGDHTVMLCGNDDEAKAQVADVLGDFGWTDVLDLGDVTGARAMEAYLPLWIRAFGAYGTPVFNTKFVR